MKIICKQTDLEHFELRYLRIDFITHYKIVKGRVNISLESFYEFNLQQSTCGHSLKLFYSDSVSVLFFFMSCCLVIYWMCKYDLPISRLSKGVI